MLISYRQNFKGLVVVPSLERSNEIGARKAIKGIQPYLAEEQIALYSLANANLRKLLSSGKSLARRKVRKVDFIIFNATGALKSPYALLLFRWAKLNRIPMFVYWRELALALKLLSEAELKRVDFFGSRRDIIHFANSNTTSDFIRERYGDLYVSLSSNCAFVTETFSRNPPLPSSDPPYVVGIGHKSDIKGIDLFIETAIQVCDQHPTAEFVWLGHGQLAIELQEKIDSRHMQSRILFPGFVEDTAFILRHASLFFMSSREESFSQATAEAMCMGRQVVTFESGGPPELLGGHGTVIPEFNTHMAASAILNYLAMSPKDLINYELRDRYLALYSPEKHAKRLSQAIRAHIK